MVEPVTPMTMVVRIATAIYAADHGDSDMP